MKPREEKPATVFRIINRKTGEPEGSYSRACCNEYDFGSLSSAREANCHGVFKDKAKYGIAKYKVTYELIEPDVDPPSDSEIKENQLKEELESEMDNLGLEGFDRVRYLMDKMLYEKVLDEIDNEAKKYARNNKTKNAQKRFKQL